MTSAAPPSLTRLRLSAGPRTACVPVGVNPSSSSRDTGGANLYTDVDLLSLYAVKTAGLKKVEQNIAERRRRLSETYKHVVLYRDKLRNHERYLLRRYDEDEPRRDLDIQMEEESENRHPGAAPDGSDEYDEEVKALDAMAEKLAQQESLVSEAIAMHIPVSWKEQWPGVFDDASGGPSGEVPGGAGAEGAKRMRVQPQ